VKDLVLAAVDVVRALSKDSLTPFSYAILVLVGRGGAGPHDLVQMARRGRTYAGAAESQFSAEPKRLAALGYLDARKEPGRTHERTHYALTDKALEALQEWARRPVRYPRVLHEGVVRLLAADLVGEPPVRTSIAGLRAELDELDGLLDQAEATAAAFPHRQRYLRINHRLARRLVAAHREWIAEVEDELAAD
jgi:PadR family transcriptional regulator, regulatory protein AphA